MTKPVTAPPATITIQRALVQLKTYDDRISNAIRTGVFVGVVKGDAQKPIDLQYKTKAELTARIQGSVDSVEGLIAARLKLKALINKSNQTTLITFQNEQISVADLIDKKKIIPHKTDYLNALKRQLNMANAEASKLSAAIEQSLTSAGGAGKDKVDEATLAAVRKVSESLSKPELISVAKDGSLSAVITQLEQEIFDFTQNVDATLSEVNAVTTIPVV